MKKLFVDSFYDVTSTTSDNLRQGTCALLAKIGHKLDMQASPVFLSVVCMFLSSGMINKRTRLEPFAPTASLLLASAIEDKAKEGIDMPVSRKRGTCRVV
jgi:hypothetical protein